MSFSKNNPFQNPFVPESLSQAINPWSLWLEGSANQNQNGFINVTNYKSGNPKLEQKIVNEVAGYGMQLGIIEDMLEMMIGFLPKSKLTAEQQKTIECFQSMITDIKAHKEKSALDELGSNGIDGIISALETLKQSDPEAYGAAVKKLNRILD